MISAYAPALRYHRTGAIDDRLVISVSDDDVMISYTDVYIYTNMMLVMNFVLNYHAINVMMMVLPNWAGHGQDQWNELKTLPWVM